MLPGGSKLSARGLFISFEGIEGAGKTTQLALASEHLSQLGRTPLLVREPGGTPLGDQLRALLLDPANRSMQPLPEFFLFCASRAQLVATVIRPALEAGRIVLCDRFTDSSMAYQGFGRGLPLETVQMMNTIATGGLKPDLTILLDLSADHGIARLRGRYMLAGSDDRFESEQLEFHRRVREGFLALAHQEPTRIKAVAANRSPRDVARLIQKLIDDGLSGNSGS